MAAQNSSKRGARWLVRLGVVAATAVGARTWRNRAVAANTLRFDHVLDPTKPFLGRPLDGGQPGKDTPSSASR